MDRAVLPLVVQQQELFPTIKSGPEVPKVPDGFRLQLDYIGPEEEGQLIAQIDAQTWQTYYRRRIQHYGFGYASGSRETAAWLRDFPAWLQPLAERVSRDAFTGPPENC